MRGYGAGKLMDRGKLNMVVQGCKHACGYVSKQLFKVARIGQVIFWVASAGRAIMMPCLVLLENNYNVSVKMRKYGKNVFTGQFFQSFALKIRI